MSDTARTNDLDAATRAIAARKLYDRAVRTFIDGESARAHHTQATSWCRSPHPAARLPDPIPRPRRGETREEQVAAPATRARRDEGIQPLNASHGERPPSPAATRVLRRARAGSRCDQRAAGNHARGR